MKKRIIHNNLMIFKTALYIYAFFFKKTEHKSLNAAFRKLMIQ